MSKIYKLRFDVDQYENINPVEKKDADYYQSFDGSPKLQTWRTMKVERMEPALGRELGDAPGFNIPVLRKRALDCLLPFILDDVEVLPLELEGEILYAINVTTVLDAIDYSRSKYVTFKDGKRILAFKKYAFRKEEIGDKNIFKIKDEPRRNPFVSEKFYSVVEKNNLKGFALELVDEI